MRWELEPLGGGGTRLTLWANIRRAHRDVWPVDVGPQCQPRAAASERLQFPPHVASAPVVFERPRRIGPLHLGLGDVRLRRSHGRELCSANGTEVSVGIERSPFAE